MIRLILTNPSQETQVLTFSRDVVTIGRSPSNEICLADLRVSKNHGRVIRTEQGFVYEDLSSTNGSAIVRNGERFVLGDGETTRCALDSGDVIEIASYSLKLDAEEPLLAKRGTSDVTVMMTRPPRDLTRLHVDVAELDPEGAGCFLQLVRETVLAKKEEPRLVEAIARVVFETFSCATHLAILARDLETGRLRPFAAQHRDGRRFDATLSQTIVDRVMREGSSLLFTGAEEVFGDAESIIRAKIETAICAPLGGTDQPFGVMQIDVRYPGKGVFTSRDLDLFTMFAGHVSLVLENLRLVQDQRRALESTINALVHSLSLKDPETAYHSERVQTVALLVGREMRLSEDEMEVLSVAAILHDTGKQGVRDEVLFKPGRLTSDESEEVMRHAEYTQGILDMICYPEHLKTVPLIAAYHHEKMNGRGPYGIPGDQIPAQARILAVADAFDAIVSKRSYKEARPMCEALAILEAGRGEEWDAGVVDALIRVQGTIARELQLETEYTFPEASNRSDAPSAASLSGAAASLDVAPARSEEPRLPKGRRRRNRANS